MSELNKKKQNFSKVIPGVLIFYRRFNSKLRENEYLLHLRYNTKFYDNHYSVPGGHNENNETYLNCAVRENEEETGLKIHKEKIKPIHIIYRNQDGEIRPDMCFLIEEWEGIPINIESHKHRNYEWYPYSKLPENMVPYVKKAITHIENGIIYHECGFNQNE